MVAIVAGAGTSVTAAGGGAWRVEKTAASTDYDASARSAEGIAGDFTLSVRDVGAPNSAIVGVSADPAASDGYADIGWCLQIYGNAIDIYESGAFVPPGHLYGETLWIVRRGDVLRYHIGDAATPATVVRSVAVGTAALWFDCSIAKPGGAVEVRFARPARRVRTRLSLGI